MFWVPALSTTKSWGTVGATILVVVVAVAVLTVVDQNLVEEALAGDAYTIPSTEQARSASL